MAVVMYEIVGQDSDGQQDRIQLVPSALLAQRVDLDALAETVRAAVAATAGIALVMVSRTSEVTESITPPPPAE